MQAAGTIFANATGKQAAAENDAALDAMQRKNEDWRNREYYADATQRADAQRLLQMTEDSIKKRNKQAAGVAAVTGGTEESVAAAKAANNEALANAASSINAQADARKAQIDQQYRANDMAFEQAKMDVRNQRAQNTAQAAQALGELGSTFFGNKTVADKIG